MKERRMHARLLRIHIWNLNIEREETSVARTIIEEKDRGGETCCSMHFGQGRREIGCDRGKGKGKRKRKESKERHEASHKPQEGQRQPFLGF